MPHALLIYSLLVFLTNVSVIFNTGEVETRTNAVVTRQSDLETPETLRFLLHVLTCVEIPLVEIIQGYTLTTMLR